MTKSLSIIIVNYNVRHFVHQCLESLLNSKIDFPLEIIVVDNNSMDGSDVMITQNFPEVRYILNKDNVGFAKANNQGISLAKMKYTLLLNPDTLIQEDTLDLTVNYMEQHPDIGALGCKLIDGSGNFLPESKRGFPTLRSAAFKMTGLSRFFPTSSFFNAYHQGHIPEDQCADIDVLCGAMMLMPTQMLQDINGLDETFFMYGEDIDLSYRIKQSGKRIVYFPDTAIIHYKGESSRKNDLKYYKMFYEAMIIFVKKHYKGTNLFLLSLFLSIAIYFRGVLGFLSRAVKKWTHLVVDGLVISFSFALLSQLWSRYYFNDLNHFENERLLVNIVLYAILWVAALYLMGNYDRKTSLKHLLAGFGLGSLWVIICYAFLPLAFRSSRALILLGAILSLLLVMGSKYIFNFIETKFWSLKKPRVKKLIIVGATEDAKEVKQFLTESKVPHEISGFVSASEQENNDPFYLNSLIHLDQVVKLFPVNEVIFCAASVSYTSILSWMSKLENRISIKIAGKALYNIIGSDSNKEIGEMYTIDLNYKIKELVYRRIKRLLDLILSVLALVLTPIRLFTSKTGLGVFAQAIKVLIGRQSWVGYHRADKSIDLLPVIDEGVFDIGALVDKQLQSQKEIHNLNEYYAKNYSIMQDIEVFAKSIFK